MKGRSVVGLFALMGLVLLAACAQQAAKGTPSPVETGHAIVREVEALRSAQDPSAIRVVVRGELPDGCTQLNAPVAQRGGGLVVVILPYSRQVGGQCVPGPLPYERVLPVDTEGFEAGRYTVSVNGVSTSFEIAMPAGQVPATAGGAAEEDPPPTRVAPVQITPTQAPTLTPTAEPTTVPDTAQATDPTPTQPAAECINKAAYYEDVTIPDGSVFDPGSTFTKTWRVRNAGDCIWEGYSLVFSGGDRLGAAERVPLGRVIAPGEIADVSIDFTTPDKPGGYLSQWMFGTADGSTFGVGNPPVGLMWTKVSVRTLVPVTGWQPASCAWQQNGSFETEVLAQLNAARSERGQAPLQLNAQLSQAAREHSQDMACNNFVEHYGSSGSNPLSRIQALGIRYRSAAENIYAGNPNYGGNPQGAVSWWMNSRIHRDAILNPRFSWVGIGYAYYDGSTYKGYYTLKFVEP
jgi:uncharacterized protein YkwD